MAGNQQVAKTELFQFDAKCSRQPCQNPAHLPTFNWRLTNTKDYQNSFSQRRSFMSVLRPVICLSVSLLLVVGCGGSPTGENSSDAGIVKQDGDSSNKQSPAERLAGTYVSDRAATIAFLESTGHYDADQLQSLGSSFGTTQLTYQGDTRTTVINGEVSTHQFAIVDSGSDHVSIESKWSPQERALMGEDSETERIEFTSDCFWLGKSQIPMDRFKEKFVRKEAPESGQE
jgi:hypothetical protein